MAEPHNIKSILDSLPPLKEGISQEYAARLILYALEWGKMAPVIESAPTRGAAVKSITAIKSAARKLKAALDDCHPATADLFFHAIVNNCEITGRSGWDAALGGYATQGQRYFGDISEILRKLAVARIDWPEANKSRPGGRTRKYRKKLPGICAEVFEHLTGLPADRNARSYKHGHKEGGPFYKFLESFWVASFGNTDGANNAIKEYDKLGAGSPWFISEFLKEIAIADNSQKK